MTDGPGFPGVRVRSPWAGDGVPWRAKSRNLETGKEQRDGDFRTDAVDGRDRDAMPGLHARR
ncbi:hypothetical protein ACQF36_43470 [Streptomyces sp. Marseille-Q5077]|uniref:hypothetical protein n=1 Tax=Streptomyces sp. Marseille-Q5077 TaxID=3418995 RepID=UPI003CFBC4E4